MDRGTSLTDIQAMDLAIKEARKGAGFVSPNPMVGCTILNNKNEFLAVGYHAKYGTDHAEVSALKQIDPADLEGARVIVTLEPCSFEGNTPSCAKTLSKLPVSEVVYGAEDPHPKVSGEGLKILEAAGIKTTHLKQKKTECVELAEIFFHNQTMKTPFVALKVATSLDGYIGLKNGESKWLTGTEAREHGHYLRGCYDAVAVGVNTFLNDDPSLDARDQTFEGTANKVVIFDSKGRSANKLLESKLLKVRPPENIFIVSSIEKPDGLAERTNWIHITSSNKYSLKESLEELYKLGIKSLYVEGGAKLHSSFISQKLCQRLYQFIAPTLVGGANGQPWLDSWGVTELVQKIQVESPVVKTFGQDLMLSGRFPL